MNRMIKGLSILLGWTAAAFVVTGHAQAETFVVDDSGGPGVDFLEIQSAIDSASPGDLIIVRRGDYPGFVLGIGLTILGRDAVFHGVLVHGHVTVSSVPSPQRVFLTGLSLNSISISSSPGHVILDSLEITPPYHYTSHSVDVSDCADVRMYECLVHGATTFEGEKHGVIVHNSRLEVIHSELRGGHALEAVTNSQSGSGGDALHSDGGSLIAVFDSSLTGGQGGDGTDDGNPWTATNPGDGGDGLDASGGTLAILGGMSTNEIRHGEGGYSYGGFGTDGSPGYGVFAGPGGSVRYSGVTVSSQLTSGSGTTTLAVPNDPFLRRLGTLQAGREQTFWIHGTPGDAVVLHLGRTPRITVDPLQAMDDLVSHQRSWSIGTIPATGALSFRFTIPNWFPGAFYFFAQADTTTPSGQRRSTNSVPIILRYL